MIPRVKLANRIAELVGPDEMRIKDPKDGWPALAEIRISSGWVPVALHAGRDLSSKRKRDTVERRLENPGQGKPVRAPAGFLPLLIGLKDDPSRPVLIAMDPIRRVGIETRQSYFFPLWMLRAAEEEGWAEHRSTSDELIRAFRPTLLPTYVELVRTGVEVPAEKMVEVVATAGIAADEPLTPRERVQRAVSALSRDWRFSRAVIAAYDERCAMCGLDLGLVVGAHIYPVSAPGSPDKVWNGLALCCNHHAAFDAHLVHVEPASLALRLHPKVLRDGRTNDQSRRFAATLLPRLRDPNEKHQTPRPVMFERRYAFFETRYDWLA